MYRAALWSWPGSGCRLDSCRRLPWPGRNEPSSLVNQELVKVVTRIVGLLGLKSGALLPSSPGASAFAWDAVGRSSGQAAGSPRLESIDATEVGHLATAALDADGGD